MGNINEYHQKESYQGNVKTLGLETYLI